MKSLKDLFGLLKGQLISPEIPTAEAKVLAMMAVIYADEKTDTRREWGLLTALCAFDRRLDGCDLMALKAQFSEFHGDHHLLFEKLHESSLERGDRFDIFASACLLASIDGNISPEEREVLERLSVALRMNQEELRMIEEHSRYVIETLRELRILV